MYKFQMTSSSIHTCFSDFPRDIEKPKLWTNEEYASYLNDYVDHFAIRNRIFLSRKVVKVTRKMQNSNASRTLKWHLTITTNGCIEEKVFEKLVIATGTNQNRRDIPFKNRNIFKGKIYHTKDYSSLQSTDIFKDKTIAEIVKVPIDVFLIF